MGWGNVVSFRFAVRTSIESHAATPHGAQGPMLSNEARHPPTPNSHDTPHHEVRGSNLFDMYARKHHINDRAF